VRCRNPLRPSNSPIDLKTVISLSLQLNYEQWGYGPPHPGAVLREQIVPKLAITRKELASRLGVNHALLGDVLGERRPITLDMARRLGTAFGNGARYWLALQMQHDVWHAERSGKVDVKPIVFPARTGKPASASAHR
jgi:antitoxin HigA-1